MSLRQRIPRHASRLLHKSIYPQRVICFRCYSVSTAEQSGPHIVPGSSASTTGLRDTKRPETLHPPPAPPRNETPSATSITSPQSQPSSQSSSSTATSKATASTSPPPQSSSPSATVKKEPKFAFKPLKAALILTPNAISRLKEMLDQPDPKLVRVGVKNRGCAGLAYHLEYVDKAGKFDEVVEQDGVKVLIDSRALFSIIGSRMDFVEDRLSARFVFDNPHVKGSCGCGESFSVS